MKRSLAVGALCILVGCGVPQRSTVYPQLRPGVQADGEHVAVRGHLYWIDDDQRPACFADNPDSDAKTFYTHISDYPGGSWEVAC